MDDPAVVAALVAGDPRGLEGAYRTYASRLYTYCRGMVRDPDLAADAVHDAFVLASQRASQLRDPERLRSWLYAIARNECLRILRGRARQIPLEEPDQMSADSPEPESRLRAAEIQELVWAAAEGLNPGDRDVFELTVRHDLMPAEVSDVLGVSLDHAHARLSRVREQMERALGALLVARTGRGDCPELASILGDWDGRLTVLIRKRVSRHMESCDVCQQRRRRVASPAALFSAYAVTPMLLVPAELWPRLERTSFEPAYIPAREAIVKRAGRFDRSTGFPRPLDARRPRVLLAGAAAVTVLALSVAGAGALSPSTEPIADQADLGPALAVPGPTSPLPSPAASPSPSSTPPGSPSPVLEPEPSVPRTVIPTPSPSATSPSDSPTRPSVPPGLAATAVPICGSAGVTLEVTATSSQPLESATLVVDVDDESADFPMNVSGSSAFGLTSPLDAEDGWWFVAVAYPSGATDETVRVQVGDPCSQ